MGRIARRKEPENWAFAEWFREQAATAADVDALVHELYRQEAAAFDCKECANCCKNISPRLDDDDIARLAEGLGTAADRVIAGYLVKNEEYGGWSFRRAPCPLLKDNLCTCYEHRPKDCASYPHLQKDRFVSRLSNTAANCAVCPVVCNVYERLKIAMGTGVTEDTK